MIEFEWSEQLPLKCPPSDASIVEHEEFFRILANNPAQEEDFDSARITYPEGHEFNGVCECKVRSCSLFREIKKAKMQISKMLKRGKLGERPISELWTGKLVLNESSGMIDSENKVHVSWWRAKNFDAVAETKTVLS